MISKNKELSDMLIKIPLGLFNEIENFIKINSHLGFNDPVELIYKAVEERTKN